MDSKTLILYFLLGGTVVSLVTYFGGQGKGLLAVFIAFFPSISILTFCTIYFGGGSQAVSSYAKSMIIMTPAWLVYVATVMSLLPRAGLSLSLVVGILAYVLASVLTIGIMRLISG